MSKTEKTMIGLINKMDVETWSKDDGLSINYTKTIKAQVWFLGSEERFYELLSRYEDSLNYAVSDLIGEKMKSDSDDVDVEIHESELLDRTRSLIAEKIESHEEVIDELEKMLGEDPDEEE